MSARVTTSRSLVLVAATSTPVRRADSASAPARRAVSTASSNSSPASTSSIESCASFRYSTPCPSPVTRRPSARCAVGASVTELLWLAVHFLVCHDHGNLGRRGGLRIEGDLQPLLDQHPGDLQPDHSSTKAEHLS